MVLTEYFQDLISSFDKNTSFDLPASKGKAFTLEFTNNEVINNKTTYYKSQAPLLPFAVSEVFDAAIKKWRRLTALDNNCKAVYEITFDIEGSKFDYQPGDTIGIIPHNSKSDVDFIINHLDIENVADINYMLNIDSGLKGAKIPTHIPVESTIRYVLMKCVDLRGVIKKLFLLALSKHTKDENEKKILEYLCTKEGSTFYTTHILNNNLCILDVFKIFKSCKPPIEILFEHLPRLLPRPYSIVNRNNKENVLKICFSVIEIENNRKGLTTGWLEDLVTENIETKMENLSLERSTKVPIYLRKNVNSFRMPENHEIPLILIGPGTGVAPYIGFLEETEVLKSETNMKFGDIWLFFGCRDSKLDFIYEDELKYFESQGVLTKLCTAFSREENNEVSYVQDAIAKYGAEITNLIKQCAHVYVCGDLKQMATQVKEHIVNVLIKYDGKTKEDAENYILNMQKEKRYIMDIWN